MGWWRDRCLVLLAGREGLSGNPEPAWGPLRGTHLPRARLGGTWALEPDTGAAAWLRRRQRGEPAGVWGMTVAVCACVCACVGGGRFCTSSPPTPRASASSAATWAAWEDGGTVTTLFRAWLLLPAPREEHSPTLHRRLSPLLDITCYFEGFASEATQGCLLALPRHLPSKEK